MADTDKTTEKDKLVPTIEAGTSSGCGVSEALALEWQQVYEKARPAIVSITSEQTQGQVVKQSIGSGFFVTRDGTIATDYHVVKNDGQLTVKTSDGKTYQATVTAVDKANDLALLKVNAKPGEQFSALPASGANESIIGQSVIGLSRGADCDNIIAHKGSYLGAGLLIDVQNRLKDGLPPEQDPYRAVSNLELSAPQGSSGGALLNKKGELIGILGFSNGLDYTLATPTSALAALLKTIDTTKAASELPPEARNRVAAPSLPTGNYAELNSHAWLKTDALIHGTLGGSATALQLIPGSRFGIMPPALTIAVGGAAFWQDRQAAIDLLHGHASLKSSASLLADGLITAGGTVSLIPKFRLAGRVAAGLGGLLKLTSV